MKNAKTQYKECLKKKQPGFKGFEPRKKKKVLWGKKKVKDEQ